jgi:hypothetical protein
MPGKGKHKEQIESNKQFFSFINKDESKFFDWNITVLFYTILHYADAFCAGKGYSKIENHKERNKLLYDFLEEKDYRLYLRLLNASKDSRYEVRCLGEKARNYCLQIHQDVYIPLKTLFEQKTN